MGKVDNLIFGYREDLNAGSVTLDGSRENALRIGNRAGTVSIDATNLKEGVAYSISYEQDGVGGRVISFAPLTARYSRAIFSASAASPATTAGALTQYILTLLKRGQTDADSIVMVTQGNF